MSLFSWWYYNFEQQKLWWKLPKQWSQFKHQEKRIQFRSAMNQNDEHQGTGTRAAHKLLTGFHSQGIFGGVWDVSMPKKIPSAPQNLWATEVWLAFTLGHDLYLRLPGLPQQLFNSALTENLPSPLKIFSCPVVWSFPALCYELHNLLIINVYNNKNLSIWKSSKPQAQLIFFMQYSAHKTSH